MVMRRAHVGVVRPFPVINVIADGPQAAVGASRLLSADRSRERARAQGAKLRQGSYERDGVAEMEKDGELQVHVHISQLTSATCSIVPSSALEHYWALVWA